MNGNGTCFENEHNYISNKLLQQYQLDKETLKLRCVEFANMPSCSPSDVVAMFYGVTADIFKGYRSADDDTRLAWDSSLPPEVEKRLAEAESVGGNRPPEVWWRWVKHVSGWSFDSDINEAVTQQLAVRQVSDQHEIQEIVVAVEFFIKSLEAKLIDLNEIQTDAKTKTIKQSIDTDLQGVRALLINIKKSNGGPAVNLLRKAFAAAIIEGLGELSNENIETKKERIDTFCESEAVKSFGLKPDALYEHFSLGLSYRNES